MTSLLRSNRYPLAFLDDAYIIISESSRMMMYKSSAISLRIADTVDRVDIFSRRLISLTSEVSDVS